MWSTLFYFGMGMLIGWLIREKNQWVKNASLLSYFLLGLMIFILGYSVGSEPSIVSRFGQLGVTAILLALGAVAGSLLTVVPFAKWLVKEKK